MGIHDSFYGCACRMDWIRLIRCLLISVVFRQCSSISMEPEEEEPLPVRVTQPTPVSRSRRSSEDYSADSGGFDFPEELTFTVHMKDRAVDLHLKRNDIFTTDIRITSSDGTTGINLEEKFAVYDNLNQQAAVVVECFQRSCTLKGTFEVDGELFGISPDQASTDLSFHILKRRSIDELKKVQDYMYAAQTPERTESDRSKRNIDVPVSVEKTVSAPALRRHRRDIPNCEIIEVKVLADNTIWNEYMSRYNNDPVQAEEEIVRYFTALFAEVNMRFEALSLFLNETTCTAFTCINVILVEVEIQRTSSWTDGLLFSDGVQTFVRGYEGLTSCGNINKNDPDTNNWDFLYCYTKTNIAVYTNGNYYDKYRTYTWLPSMCNSNRFYSVSIQEARGDGETQQAAHDLAHSLNARDDSQTSCDDSYSIMTKIFSDRPFIPSWALSFYFSDCTISEICSYIQNLNNNNNNCMRQHSFSSAEFDQWLNVSALLPGQIYSADAQCQERWGSSSQQCDPTGTGDLFPPQMCARYIYCTKGGQCVCPIRVFSGTPCGFARYCFMGDCIPIPDQPLGGDCDCHSQCTVENAVCDPETNTCVCADGYEDSNGDAPGGVCVPLVPNNGSCTSDHNCLDPNAECINGTCQCRAGYEEVNGTCECTGVTCPAGEVIVDDTCVGTMVGDPCSPVTDTCVNDFAACNGTVCDCISGFSWNGTHCVGSDLCDPCDQSPDSCTPPLQCGDSNRCECPDGEVQVGDMCYGTDVGDPCTPNPDTCADNNANCNGTVCDCVPGFYWNGTLCVGSDLCDPCDPSPDSCTPPLQCGDTTNRCECPDGQVQVGDSCYGTDVGDPCTPNPDTCADNNANCNGTVCDCVAGFSWNGTHCVGSDLCDPCDPSPDSCTPPLQCGDTNRCECPDGEVQIGDDCYGTHVGDPCTIDLDTCADNNANCNGSVCNCVSGFYWNGTLCVGSELCDPCDQSPDSCNPPLQCGDTTNRCECPDGEVQVGDACYGTDVGDPCTPNPDTCADNNANCNGTVCDCVAGFTWNGTHCVGSDLCDPCDQSPDSCTPPLQCGDTNRCECPDGQVQIGDNCYGTHVGDPCTTSLDTCVDNNANCNGTVCDCIAGFYWNGTLCVGSDLCDPCDPSPDSCTPPLQCGDTNRCECPDGQVQVGDECFSLICGSCQSDSDCYGANTVCVNNMCACETGFFLDDCGTCQPKRDVNESCNSDDECESGYCICGNCEENGNNDCCAGCEDKKLDLSFVLDSSTSVGNSDYQLEKGFVINMINAFTVSQQDTRVAAVDFSTSVHTNIGFLLNEHNSNAAATSDVQSFPYSGGFTRSDLALLYLADVVYTAGNGDRANVDNVVIFITDGESNNGANVPAAAAYLKANVPDLEIFAVGVTGSVNEAELETIATDPGNVFLTPDFDTLDSIVSQVLGEVCSN